LARPASGAEPRRELGDGEARRRPARASASRGVPIIGARISRARRRRGGQVANVRRRSFMLQRAIPARLLASRRSRLHVTHGRNSAPSEPSAKRRALREQGELLRRHDRDGARRRLVFVPRSRTTAPTTSSCRALQSPPQRAGRRHDEGDAGRSVLGELAEEPGQLVAREEALARLVRRSEANG
jgi:hypothetical protein